MGLPEYADVLRRRWRSVLALCLLGALVAVGVSLLDTSRSASTTLILETADPADATSGTELAGEHLASYGELATSPRIAGAVADDLGAGDARSLARDLSASTSPESLLLVLTARDRVPEVARAKATSASEQLIDLVDEVSPQGPGLVVAQPAVLEPPVGLLGALSTALLGAALGLAAGIALALLRDGTDPRVRSAPSTPDGDGRSPVLLAELPVTAERLRRHAGAAASEGPAAEGFRRLRTSLLAQGGDQRTVLVTSARSAEGASEVARGLAVTLARGGLRVALLDAHLRGRPDDDAADGAALRAGLPGVLRGRCSVQEALTGSGEPGLALLPGGGAGADAGELLTSEPMAKVVAALQERADVVVLDAPAVLPFADAAAVTASVGAQPVLVVRRGVTRQSEAASALRELQRVSPSGVGVGVVVLADPGGGRERAR